MPCCDLSVHLRHFLREFENLFRGVPRNDRLRVNLAAFGVQGVNVGLSVFDVHNFKFGW